MLTVSLDPPAESALAVPWRTQDDRAEAPNDYGARQDTVTFAVGETRKTISVPIVDDAVREDPVNDVGETFFVLLSSGQGYGLGDGVAIVEIRDDDVGGTEPPRNGTEPPRDGTEPPGGGGTAPPGWWRRHHAWGDQSPACGR